MGIGRPVRIGVILLTLINIVPAAEADESWALFGVCVAAAALSFSVPYRGRRSGGRNALVHAGVLASMVFLIYEMFLDRPSVYVLDLAHFMMLLAACKFFDLWTARDIGLVAVIAFLVLLIGALASGSILFAAAVFIDVTFGVWWIISFQMKREEISLVERRTAALAGAMAEAGPALPDAPTNQEDRGAGAPRDLPRVVRSVRWPCWESPQCCLSPCRAAGAERSWDGFGAWRHRSPGSPTKCN